jgi:three-Cys-motif partner protein
MAKKDPWPQLLESVATPDGLPVRECGKWTETKLHFWAKYIDITTRAMVGNPNWPDGLVYIDLFAGPGVCEVRESKKRLPGSPIIAAQASKAFRKIIAVELKPENAKALDARLVRFSKLESVKVLQGACEDLIEEVVAEIPGRVLALAFIDPEGFDVSFKMLELLVADGRRVDFLILFADAIDLVRNVDQYEKVTDSKLYEMLGDSNDWLADWQTLENRSGPSVREFFSQKYAELIRSRLDYCGVRQEIIQGPSGPLYRLIFASRHERGLEFWDKIVKIELGGQRRLF